MDKQVLIHEVLEKIDEIGALIESWPDDEFYIALEYHQQLRDEIQSLSDE